MPVAIYPGQGAQAVGMGKDFYENFSSVAQLFEEASDTLKINFKKLLFEGPEDELQLTFNTQPALLLASVAAHTVMKQELDFAPTAAAGHSVGEYAALVGAGILPFAVALKAVRKRGEAMQNAVPVGQGGMVAVLGLEANQIEIVCRYAVENSGASPVEPANLNAPGQIVISGNKTALDWLVQNYDAETAGLAGTKAKFIPLKVSAPFHCSMMKPAEDLMRSHLKDIPFRQANYPVVQNVTGKAVSIPTELRENLIRQISAPVRWIDCVKTLEGYDDLAFELGPGRILAGLVKKISDKIKVMSVSTVADLKEISGVLNKK